MGESLQDYPIMVQVLTTTMIEFYLWDIFHGSIMTIKDHKNHYDIKLLSGCLF